MAENRFKFSRLCDALDIDQPEWSEFTTYEEAEDFCAPEGRGARRVCVQESSYSRNRREECEWMEVLVRFHETHRIS